MTDVPESLPEGSLLDDEIAAIALQLEEIAIIEGKCKGKYPVGNPSDSKFAFDNFHNDLLAHLSFLKDAKLAHSIAHAVDTDAQAIAELTEPEKRAQEDRHYAIFLSDETIEGLISPGITTGHTAPDQEPFKGTGVHGISFDDSDNENKAGPSVSYADRQAQAFVKFSDEHQCSVCFENYRTASMVPLPCGDQYCIECLKSVFLNAVVDETLFPPRCCRQSIPLRYIQQELSSQELNTFRSAAVEFSTRDRTYCSNLRCGIFIPPTEIAKGKAQCPQCFTETCTACKAALHDGEDCPADTALQATLSLSQEQGWQRCYACRAMVELDYGCNHMTCVCLSEFSWLMSIELLTYHVAANVALSFVISVVLIGSTAHATSGTKKGSSSELVKWLIGICHASFHKWN